MGDLDAKLNELLDREGLFHKYDVPKGAREKFIAEIHKAYYEEYGPQIRELKKNVDEMIKMLGIK